MVLAFSFPCPAMGWNVTTGTPGGEGLHRREAARVLDQRVGGRHEGRHLAVQPMTVPPNPSSISDARSLSSRPQTVIG